MTPAQRYRLRMKRNEAIDYLLPFVITAGMLLLMALSFKAGITFEHFRIFKR